LDPYKFSCSDMAKAHVLTYEALLEDEVNQVYGFSHVSDLAGVSAAHVTLWSPSEFATAVKWGEVRKNYETVLNLRRKKMQSAP
jgi:hypothetical protein